MNPSGRLRPLLLNPYEQAADGVLGELASKYGDRLNPKTRLASVIDLNSLGLSGAEFSFALKAELDFCMFDEDTLMPKFAIELDGAQHWTDPEQRRRDDRKDRICKLAGLPLLRITTDFVKRNGRWPVLSYLVDTYYRAEVFFAAQEDGTIPLGEPYSHASFNIMSTRDEPTISSIDKLAIDAMHGAFDRGEIPQAVPNCVMAKAPDERAVRAFGYLPIARDRYLVGEAQVRSFSYPGITPPELAEELCIAEIGDQMKGWLEGKPVARGPREMERKAAEVQQWIDAGQFLCGLGGSSAIQGSQPFTIRVTNSRQR